jgi:hypothetical protein
MMIYMIITWLFMDVGDNSYLNVMILKKDGIVWGKVGACPQEVIFTLLLSRIARCRQGRRRAFFC